MRVDGWRKADLARMASMRGATPAGRGSKRRVRFYVHGDEHETDRAHYLCRRCDVFAGAEHFEPGQCPCNRSGRDDAALVAFDLKTLPGVIADKRTGIAVYRPAHARTVWNRPRG